MFLQDFISRPWRFFRQKINGLSPAKKGNYGLEINGQDQNGYKEKSRGDEQGWLFSAGHFSRGFGSWSQAVPAIWDKSQNKVFAIKNKALDVDADYLPKNISAANGDDHLTVRIAETLQNGNVPGIIVTCLNHDSQEQIFFPLGGASSEG